MCKALGWVGVKPWVDSLSAEGTVRGRELELITENLDPSGVLERPAACGREDTGIKWRILKQLLAAIDARRSTRESPGCGARQDIPFIFSRMRVEPANKHVDRHIQEVDRLKHLFSRHT